MRSIAVIGSSGGNLFRQGGNNPIEMIFEIQKLAEEYQLELSEVLFVGASGSMDRQTDAITAQLFTMTSRRIEGGEPQSLKAINKIAKKADGVLSELIVDGKIDGMILISCDPQDVNHESIMAAVEKGIPLVGTGGTSMAIVQKMGGNVISSSGTTGTTNSTRAAGYISAFAKYWKLVPTKTKSADAFFLNALKRINFQGIMMAAMPCFIAASIIRALAQVPGLEILQSVFRAFAFIYPVALAALTAHKLSGLDEVGICTGVVAGALSARSGVIGGIVIGIVAGLLVIFVFRFCQTHKFAGTITNVCTIAISGLVAGLLGMFVLAVPLSWLGDSIRSLLDTAIQHQPLLVGIIAGLIIWLALFKGIYHSFILPLIILEIEDYGISFLGAIDIICLIVVCAGITTATTLFSKNVYDRKAALAGLKQNILFGSYAEAAYPYMLGDKRILASAIISAGLAGGVIGWFKLRSIAYVPVIFSFFISEPHKWCAIGLSCFIAFIIPFTVTGIVNKRNQKYPPQSK